MPQCRLTRPAAIVIGGTTDNEIPRLQTVMKLSRTEKRELLPLVGDLRTIDERTRTRRRPAVNPTSLEPLDVDVT